MKYLLSYNEFHNLESIGIDGRSNPLINYTYKNGNGKLKEVAYANGHRMKVTYNNVGQIVAEKWYNLSNTLKQSYKYTYDEHGNIVRSLDITAKKEYNYEYDEGSIINAVEYNVTLSGELVTARTLVNRIRYYYNSSGQLARKVITPASGSSVTYSYNYPDNADPKVTISAGGVTTESLSETDALGRKKSDEVRIINNGSFSRTYTYHLGERTEEHQENNVYISAPTTQLVSQITYSDGRTLSYEYDAEERITKVTDVCDGATTVTEYTYDALGQLLCEKVNGTVVNTMTYDNYGNIKSSMYTTPYGMIFLPHITT